MKIEIDIRENSIYLRLRERSRKKDSREQKNLTIPIGTYPKDLKLDSDEGRALLHKIVNTLDEFYNGNEPEVTLSDVDFTDRDYADFIESQLEDEPAQTYNLGIATLFKVLDEVFDLKPFFHQLQETTKRGYSLNTVFDYIVSMQIVDPGSLRSYYEKEDKYIRLGPGKVIPQQDLYDFLTFFYEHRLEFQKHFFKTVMEILGPQQVHIVYYDGTNFYFEISDADPDCLNELDEVVRKGLRKYGKSKDGRFVPVVGLGIISSSLGIPLFFSVFPGNEQEISHIQEDINKLRQSLLDENYPNRFLVCADAGNYSGDVIFRLAGKNLEVANPEDRPDENYLIGRGVGQVDGETRKWMLNWEGYNPLTSLKSDMENKRTTFIKDRIEFVPVKVKLSSGKTVKTETRQLQVALFSTKRQYRAFQTIMKNVERAANLQNKSSGAEFQNLLKDIMSSKYIKTEVVDKETGKVKEEIQLKLDEKKINKDFENAGYFMLACSKTHWSASKVVTAYRDKITAEFIFREMKDYLHTRPVFVRTPEHIVAHIELCVLAVILLNTMRHIIIEKAGVNLTPREIQKTLGEFSACPLGNRTYRITGNDGKMKIINESFKINIPKCVLTLPEIIEIFDLEEHF